jgi:fructokinase
VIVVAGEALIDRLVASDGSVRDVPGGGPFNTARTIARLGVPVAFLGCLSTDAAGVRLRGALEGDGVDASFVTSTDAPTTLAVARLDDDGVARYAFEVEGTSAPELSGAAVRAALAWKPEALHVGSLGLVLEPMATALADGVREAAPDTLVMLDPNGRPDAIPDLRAYLDRLLGIVPRVDIVKASQEDLDMLWPGMPATVAAHRLLTAGPRLLVVTRGAEPVTAFTPEWSVDVAVPVRPVVDTVGAGDAFGGALLARLVERGAGRPVLTDRQAVHEAVVLAVGVAAATCDRPGADPPRRDEVRWPRR